MTAPPSMSFYHTYVGIPYSDHGVNCWGLVRLVYSEQFGILIPAYEEGPSGTDTAAVRAFMAQERAHLESTDWRQVESPEPGDVALFRRGMLPAHVGIVVEPGLMLHSQAWIGSAIESYKTAAWRPRLLGFFRHRERLDGT